MATKEGSCSKKRLDIVYQFGKPISMGTPSLRELNRYVTPQYAVHWKEIGIQLGLSDAKLKIIRADNPNSVEKCCNEMLAQWLQLYSTATWNELFEAINCCTESSGKDDDQIHPSSNNMPKFYSLSMHLKDRYVHTRFVSEQEEWPPDQPKHFTNLTLIHHKGGRTEMEVIAINKILSIADTTRLSSIDIIHPTSPQKKALVAHSKEIQTFFEQTKTSKSISVIFVHPEGSKEPRSILIEGAPGIGKTILSKEISVQWAKGLLLVDTNVLFLLFLRDPLVQKITSLKDLVKYYYQFDESSDAITSSCADYLLHSGGENVSFVLDGYDEFPESLQQNSLVYDLLQHKLLPKCRLVVTSRPHASAHLHKNFDCRVDILGFTEDDRLHYIHSSLKGEVEKITTLVKYLKSHPTINSLCFTPFNMTVLLWLFKQRITLPDSSTELCSYFICHTIRHHLAKSHVTFDDDISNLENLREPYKKVIQQLSHLSYEALSKNQLTFTLDEIKTACPQIAEITGAINCFGLLQAIQHPGVKKTSTTFNFIHFSLQEFLAAYHITCLSDYDEFCVLKEKFMSKFLTNTFNFYVGMTKGQRPAFKKYISNSWKWTAYLHDTFKGLNPFSASKITINFKNPLAYIRLYKCCCEAGDSELCNEITNVFSKGEIDLAFQTLIPVDVECLCLFLNSRHEWKHINLEHCHIGDVGIHFLHQLLTVDSPSIHTLRLSSNNISSSSGSFIADIVACCKIKMLFLSNNLLENIFTLIGKDQLKDLFVTVSDKPSTVDSIAAFLHENDVLETLDMELHIPPSINSVQWISEKSIDLIANSLKYNTKLKTLAFPGLYTVETHY